MHGSNGVRFTSLFADTVRTHGLVDAARIYKRNGVPMWEMLVWIRTMRALRIR